MRPPGLRPLIKKEQEVKISRPTRPPIWKASCFHCNTVVFRKSHPPALPPYHPPKRAVPGASGRKADRARIFEFPHKKFHRQKYRRELSAKAPSSSISFWTKTVHSELFATKMTQRSVQLSNYHKNVNLACETLQSSPASATMEVSPNPAVEPENRPRAATLKPLVYRVDEIAQLLAISPRAAAGHLSSCCLQPLQYHQGLPGGPHRYQHPCQPGEF